MAGQHELDSALTQFREAVRLAPTNANLVLNLGNVLVMAGHTNEAASVFAEAARLQPDLPQKLAESGAAFAAQGNPQAAVARFTTALYLKPDAQWCFELAGLLQRLGQSQEAVRRYEQALQLKPEFASARCDLAHQLQQMCQWDELPSLAQGVIEAVDKNLVVEGVAPVSPFSFM